MKKIKMTLQTNNKTISNKTYNYIESNSYKILKFNNLTLKFKLNTKSFIFIRETNEDIFKIEKNKGSITLKELNTTFDIELSKCTYTKEDNNYTIVYSIEGDNNEVKIKLKDLI